MRYTILIGLFFIGLNPIAQDVNPIHFNSVDSIEIIVYHNITKEMLIEGEQEEFEELGRAKLKEVDVKRCMKLMTKKSAFDERTALINHHNVVFKLYKNGKMGTLEISSFTRTVYYYCNANIKLDLGWVGQASRKLEKLTVYLLQKYRLWNLIDEDMRFVRV